MQPLRNLYCVGVLVLASALCGEVVAQVDQPGDKDKKVEKKGEKKAEKKKDVFTNAAEAGPDYLVQGEYLGVLGQNKYGAQVVARGEGKFEVYILEGGLPGAGWNKRGCVKIHAQTVDGKVELKGFVLDGLIEKETLRVQGSKEQAIELKRIERKSPTLGLKPPGEAVVLFDGSSVDGWKNGKLVEDMLLLAGTDSKQNIGAGKLHLEFRTPFQPRAGGQGRGNSGVYLFGREIQVLDSFGLDAKKDDGGAFYGSAAPKVNMSLPPLTWQTYDVDLKTSDKDLLVTVRHNGVVIHEDFAFKGAAGKMTHIHLQNHGNPVMYRNIWFVPETN